MLFQREPITDEVIEQIKPLLQAHFDEVEHYKDIPLDPNYAAYKALDEAGVVRLFTVRKGLELVGYSIMFVMPAYHYKGSLQATHDSLFILKGHRGCGEKFIQFCDSELQSEGVQVVYQSLKLTHNFGHMLERIGYQHVDNVYYRRLN